MASVPHRRFDTTTFHRQLQHRSEHLQQQFEPMRMEFALSSGLVGDDSFVDDGPPPLVCRSDSDSDEDGPPPLVPA